MNALKTAQVISIAVDMFAKEIDARVDDIDICLNDCGFVLNIKGYDMFGEKISASQEWHALDYTYIPRDIQREY